MFSFTSKSRQVSRDFYNLSYLEYFDGSSPVQWLQEGLLISIDVSSLPVLAMGHQLSEEFCNRSFWQFIITFDPLCLMIGLFIQKLVLRFASAASTTKHRDWVFFCVNCQCRAKLRVCIMDDICTDFHFLYIWKF